MIWREINRKMILKNKKKKEKRDARAKADPTVTALDVHSFSWLKPQGNM